MPNNIRCMKAIIAIALLPLLLLSAQVFGQSGGSVRGTVMDASQAVLPGASITAINVDTGVETKATTNNAGVYNFPSLQSGTYNIVVEAAGFLRATTTDVRVRLDAVNLNFNMVVAGGSETVEVTGTAENMNLDAGSSTGTVIQEDIVASLPLVSGDVMDLVNIMGGVVKSENALFYGGESTIAGIPSAGINIQRDGISVNEIRYNSGIATPSRMNQELVGEMKMVLSPVDAEMGRGAGQIQMTTKSGANTFHGSAVWNIQNTALDSREWEDKNTAPDAVAPAAWRNVNNYTLSLSGPIIKNKTFFFVSWDHQISRSRSWVRTNVLTACARKGIYRYLDGITSAAYGSLPTINQRTVSTTDANGAPASTALFGPTRPVVDVDGNVVSTNYGAWANTTQYTLSQPNGYVGNGIDLAGKTEQQAFPDNPNIGRLVYQQVLGELTGAQRTALANGDDLYANSQYAKEGSSIYTDCGTYNLPVGTSFTGFSYDKYRNSYDPSGYVYNFSQEANMPLPRDFTQGDGLNYAAYGWTRTTSGADTVFGTLYDPNRKSITTKIDHNLNTEHRLSGTYSYESNYGEDAGNLPPFPGAYGGSTERKPQSFTVTLTSTLKPTLLNELRVGLSRTQTRTNNSLTNSKTGDQVREALLALLPTDGWAYNDVVLAGPGNGNTLAFPGGNLGNIWGSGITSTWGGVDPRWTFNDTLTWMKGAHSFKGGFEYRMNKSYQEQNGNAGFTGINTFPAVRGGVITPSTWQAENGQQGDNIAGGPLSGLNGRTPWAGLNQYENSDRGSGQGLSTKYTTAYDMMAYMAGSVGSIDQYFYVADAKNPRWNRPGEGELTYVSDLRGREFNFFFKDDWRINSDLTLNLGVRYEYYGPPYVANGLAASVRDGVDGMFGVSRNLGAWMPDLNTLQSQGALNYTTLGTEQIFVGPNSPNSDLSVFNKDLNNWAPHVGFAWQLPWLGKGKTTLRGGYSVSYMSIGNYDNNFGYSAMLAHAPGMTYDYTFNGCDTSVSSWCPNDYMSFANLRDFLPLNPTTMTGRVPMGADGYSDSLRPDQRGGSVTIYDPNVRNPYVQNLNLSLTRQLGNALTLDVRYVGTLTRKSVGTYGGNLNLNTVNYINNGLFDEFANLRAGVDPTVRENYPILNTYVPSYLTGSTASLYAPLVNGQVQTNLTGAQQVLYQYFGTLAQGNFSSVASSLAGANFSSNLTSLDPNDPNYRPLLPTGKSGGQVLREGGAPANLIWANPQYDGATIQRNQGRSNYHSMQVQLTMRPIRGLSFQTTYTWSRNLSRGAVLDWNDPNWTMDYGLSGQHRSHTLNSYGTYELPFGARGFFFRNASGAVKKAIEGWQISWIATASSGVPASLTGDAYFGNGAAATLWSTAKAVQVGPFDTKDTSVDWIIQADGTMRAQYFNKPYSWTNDPQCASSLVAQNLSNPYATNTTMVSSCNSARKALMQTDTGQIIFQNAVPGEIGNVQSNFLTGPGRWNVDMTLAKSVEFMEGKRLEIRLDAANIFNHPIPSFNSLQFVGVGASAQGSRTTAVTNPYFGLNDNMGGFFPFGYINSKGGHRTFQAKLRLSF